MCASDVANLVVLSENAAQVTETRRLIPLHVFHFRANQLAVPTVALLLSRVSPPCAPVPFAAQHPDTMGDVG
jgi:hypothetical protein